MKQRKKTKSNMMFVGGTPHLESVEEILKPGKMTRCRSESKLETASNYSFTSDSKRVTEYPSSDTSGGKSGKNVKKSSIQLRREEKAQRRMAASSGDIDFQEANYASRYISRTEEKDYSNKPHFGDIPHEHHQISSPDSSALKRNSSKEIYQEDFISSASAPKQDTCVHNQDTQDSMGPREKAFSSPNMKKLDGLEMVKSPCGESKRRSQPQVIEEDNSENSIKPDIRNLNVTSVKNSDPTKRKALKLNSEAFNTDIQKTNLTQTLEDIKHVNEEIKHFNDEIKKPEITVTVGDDIEPKKKDDNKNNNKDSLLNGRENGEDAPVGKAFIWDLLRKKTDVKMMRQISANSVDSSTSSEQNIKTKVEKEDLGGKEVFGQKNDLFLPKKIADIDEKNSKQQINGAVRDLNPIPEEKPRESNLKTRSEFNLIKASSGVEPVGKKQNFYNQNNSQPRKLYYEDKKINQGQSNKKKEMRKPNHNGSNSYSSSTSTSNYYNNSQNKYESHRKPF
jgi:hypothetical protein